MKALRLFLTLTVITGVIYPLFIFLVAFLFFSESSTGNLIKKDNKIIGAKFIGQEFKNERYFFSRPSATNYDGTHSGGSNLNATSKILRENVKKREDFLSQLHQAKKEDIPAELVFSSASGLDPHISKKAAYFQMDRIMKARGNSSESNKKAIFSLIDQATETASFWEPTKQYVNVLLLNLSLDSL